jgi:radical SAM superfamily enzyme YgiQ (UPF0313 family)
MHIPEQLVIRPPSEATSLLVRVVRGCNWNRCLFCGIYDLYGTPYSTREVEDVKKDIDALAEMYGNQFKTAFLGDANPLELDTDFLVEVLEHLHKQFPSMQRVTAYARSSSLWKKTLEDLKRIHEAGLHRLHVGMESGSSKVLALHKKGTNQEQHIASGKMVMDAGFELSYYFLLGLGGTRLWEEHVHASAKVVNEVKPHFLRVRRLWIHPMSRLNPKIESSEFEPQTPEGTVLELRDFLQALDAEGTVFTCDHTNNYIRIHGKLMQDKQALLDYINKFLALPADTRASHYESVPSVI